ncbi:hypothetical protein [Frankia tisae]|uniref:hypothetical protein n=1 Tax=Frankia tisae TaxID=2950104 RepID=UPI0021C1A01E|nr:hypothetical protein [Frankia tisae]
MPEGDTVWRAARRMDAALAGARLLSTDFRMPRLATADLSGQRIIAGLGNIWRTEACFVTGVSPWTPVGDVPDLPGLVRRAQTMIKAGAHGGHQVTTGSLRPGEEHWVYGRAGRPCRRTTWCPRCQAGPAAPVGTVTRRGHTDRGAEARSGRVHRPAAGEGGA